MSSFSRGCPQADLKAVVFIYAVCKIEDCYQPILRC